MPSSKGTGDKITVGPGTLQVYQEHRDRTTKLRVDSIERLDSSHIGTTYVVRKGQLTNLFIGRAPTIVKRAIAEAKRRGDALGDRQLSIPGSEGPDEF